MAFLKDADFINGKFNSGAECIIKFEKRSPLWEKFVPYFSQEHCKHTHSEFPHYLKNNRR